MTEDWLCVETAGRVYPGFCWHWLSVIQSWMAKASVLPWRKCWGDGGTRLPRILLSLTSGAIEK